MTATLWQYLGTDMATAGDYHSLEEAANRYLSNQDFGVPEVEAVMLKVFGESRTRICASTTKTSAVTYTDC